MNKARALRQLATTGIICFLLFAACHQEPPKRDLHAEAARDYNNQLMSLHDSLIHTRALVAEAYSENSSAAIQKAEQLFRQKIKSTRDTLSHFADFESDSSLRLALLDVVKMYENYATRLSAMRGILLTEDAVDTIAHPDLPIINPETDTLDPNDALAGRFEAIANKLIVQEEQVMHVFDSVQHDFAKRYRFMLSRNVQPQVAEE